jgi:ribosome-binding ATPase YchF (GTP1/OBG family)
MELYELLTGFLFFALTVSNFVTVIKRSLLNDLFKEFAKANGNETVKICAKIEEDLCDLDDEEKEMFLEELGLEESGLDRLVAEAYSLLGLETFFTEGEKECRAWTFKKGMKAPECAGVIHTDFEKGFIKAEVVSYDDFIQYGSWAKVREAGKLRLEGKDYVFKDGDITVFRFNVSK